MNRGPKILLINPAALGVEGPASNEASRDSTGGQTRGVLRTGFFT